MEKASTLQFHKPSSFFFSERQRKLLPCTAPCPAELQPLELARTVLSVQPAVISRHQPCTRLGWFNSAGGRRKQSVTPSECRGDCNALISTAPVNKETLKTEKNQSPEDISVLHVGICITACSQCWVRDSGAGTTAVLGSTDRSCLESIPKGLSDQSMRRKHTTMSWAVVVCTSLQQGCCSAVISTQPFCDILIHIKLHVHLTD